MAEKLQQVLKGNFENVTPSMRVQVVKMLKQRRMINNVEYKKLLELAQQ